MHKIRTPHNHPDGKVFAWMALLMGLGIGLVLPIFPGIVKSLMGTDSNVSLFYSFIAIMMLLASLLSTVLFRKISRTTITKIGFLTMGGIFFLLIFVTRWVELGILESIRVWFELILYISLALFVRDFANTNDLGENEGLYYRFQNIGFFIGPLLGGFLATQLSYELVFILATAVLLAAMGYFYNMNIIEKHAAILNIKGIGLKNLCHNIKEFISDEKRVKAYLMTLFYMIWVAFKKLYVPLFVIFVGYKEGISGLILSLTLVPLILLEVRAGKYAEKHGVRKPISFGFLTMGATFILIFLSPWPILSLILIPLVNLGGAWVEPVQEYYLFKNLPKDREEDLYGVYMTAGPLGYFFAPLIGAVILFFFPFKFIFLFFGLIFLGISLYFFKHLQRL